MKKLYFPSISGKIRVVTVLNSEEAIKKGLTPRPGCNILIKSKAGFIYSANSKSYFESLEDACNNAIENNLIQVSRLIDRLNKKIKTIEKFIKIMETKE